jgi:hypothetical protein
MRKPSIFSLRRSAAGEPIGKPEKRCSYSYSGLPTGSRAESETKAYLPSGLPAVSEATAGAFAPARRRF